MCIYPIKIKNRSLTYSPLISPKYIEVPCGHCPECVHAQQNEWFIRISSEIESSKISFFYTLTYDENNIPKFVSKNISGKCINVFSYRNVKLFNDRLRRYLFSCGFTRYSYRFMMVSEYGKRTSRPHHHLLLCCKDNISPYDMTRCIERAWTFGFVSPNSPVKSFNGYDFSKNAVIKSLKGGAYYVSKYISKDIDFYNLPYIKKFLDKRQDKEVYKRNYEEIKPFLPRHWQSHGFGLDIISDPSSWSSLLNEGVDMSYTDRTGKFHKSLVPLSRYLKEKILYNTIHYSDTISKRELNSLIQHRKMNKDNTFTPESCYISSLFRSKSHSYRKLTDFGRDYFLSSYLLKCQNLAKSFENFFSKNDYSNIIPDYKFIREDFHKCLGTHSYFDLAVFVLVYHGYTNNTDIFDKVKDFYLFPPFQFTTHTSLDTFLSSAIDVYSLRCMFCGSWFGKVADDENNIPFDVYPAFRKFARAFALYLQNKGKVNIQRNQKELELQYIKKHLKEYGITNHSFVY